MYPSSQEKLTTKTVSMRKRKSPKFFKPNVRNTCLIK